MVLYWKTWCALCGGLPPSKDCTVVYPDLRNNAEVFEVARSFYITNMRKCPTCPECVKELERVLSFAAKCHKAQSMLKELSANKHYTIDEMIAFRTEYLSKKNETKAKQRDIKPMRRFKPEIDEIKEDPDAEPSILEFVEIVTTKEENYYDEVVPAEKEIIEEDSKHNIPMDTNSQMDNLPTVDEEDQLDESQEHEETEDGDIGGDESMEGENEDQEQDNDFLPEGEEVDQDDENEDDDKWTPSSTMRKKRVKKFSSRAPGTKRNYKFSQKCSHCDLILYSRYHLKLHEKKHAPKPPTEYPFICDHCGKKYKHSSHLKAHSTVHTDEKPFACEKCPMAFKNIWGLKVHMETHTDTKYICPTCGLQLGSNHTYHAHMKVHSDHRPYKCNVCPKTFKRHTPLKEHLFGHTDIRPYRCPFCEKTFVNGSSCRLHKVRLHPQELAALEASGRNAEVLAEHRQLPTLKEIQARIAEMYNLKESGESSSKSN